jgi:hypothetical protein
MTISSTTSFTVLNNTVFVEPQLFGIPAQLQACRQNCFSPIRPAGPSVNDSQVQIRERVVRGQLAARLEILDGPGIITAILGGASQRVVDFMVFAVGVVVWVLAIGHVVPIQISLTPDFRVVVVTFLISQVACGIAEIQVNGRRIRSSRDYLPACFEFASPGVGEQGEDGRRIFPGEVGLRRQLVQNGLRFASRSREAVSVVESLCPFQSILD